MMLKISVVTVVHNSAGTIEEAIRSVMAQAYPRVEHIVIDGASTDGTVATLQKYSEHFTRIVSEPDRGIYDAMNKGIALTTGDVIGFLNADDIYAHKDVLSRVAGVMADPQVDACYADLVYVDKGDPNKVVRYWKSRPYQEGLFLNGWMPAHPTFFVRRSVYERFGDFDLSFRRQSDFELALRFMHVHKIRTVYIPEIFVRMRMGGLSNSSWHGILDGNLEAYRACKKHHLPVSPLFMLRKFASRLPQFFHRAGIK